MGVAQAPLFPILSGHSIARWFPVSAWALPNALTNAGLTLGSAATAPLVAWLAQTVGWRASFTVTAPIAFLMRLALVALAGLILVPALQLPAAPTLLALVAFLVVSLAIEGIVAIKCSRVEVR